MTTEETLAAVPPPFNARRAAIDDAPDVVRLVNQWAERGLTIARSLADIERAIENFAVVERGGVIIACAALERVSDDVAEIRSVAVDASAVGSGAGRVAVLSLVDRAEEDGYAQVVLLTKTPGFFVRCGFVEIDVADAPSDFIEGTLPSQGRTTRDRAVMRRQLTTDIEVVSVSAVTA